MDSGAPARYASSMQKGDHLFLVDGSAYIFRAYHALPPLTRKSDGLPVGAVAGFCNMLWKLVEESRDTSVGVAPTHFAVIFDHSSTTFRNALYDGYKSNRPAPPEDLRPQFALIREAVRAFDLPCIEKQGSLPRGKLLAEFRNDTHSVLVGTTSFWQGVDVPGESLSCVVITKLPFAVPDEPMVQARVETIKSRGRNAFQEYQVPQAVMMFRQGFGRLIRTASDRGVVAILDPRVKTQDYGRVFLDSLPSCEVTEELERLSLFVSGA